MNGCKTSGVIESSEQTIIDQMVARLAVRYPALSASTVADVVRNIHSRYDGRPLRDYVPLFVERHANHALQQLMPVGPVPSEAPA